VKFSALNRVALTRQLRLKATFEGENLGFIWKGIAGPDLVEKVGFTDL